MNERIRQLAEQAGEYVNTVYTPPVRSKTPGKIWEDGHVGWNEQFNEKFALLLMREIAIVQITHQATMDLENKKMHDPAKELNYAVIEHFGVEE